MKNFCKKILAVREKRIRVRDAANGTYELTFEGDIDGYTAYVKSSITKLKVDEEKRKKIKK